MIRIMPLKLPWAANDRSVSVWCQKHGPRKSVTGNEFLLSSRITRGLESQGQSPQSGTLPRNFVACHRLSHYEFQGTKLRHYPNDWSSDWSSATLQACPSSEKSPSASS